MRVATIAVAILLFAFTSPEALHGQRVNRTSWSLVRGVMPGADRFDDGAGDPPVIVGYRTGSDGSETLHGYVFLTSDLPPEQYGYSGPIEALVGMLPDGTLTGIQVTDYNESYMRTMGDFLSAPGFQEQFAGKHIGDPFRVWSDIEGISRVSITVRALSRGVRDAARRVASVYAAETRVGDIGGEAIDPVGRSWFELRQLGVVKRFEVTEPRMGSAGISVAHIDNERTGEYFFGAPLYERALRAVERRGGADHIFLYSVDGSRLRLFHQEGWSLEQDGDTVAIDPRDVVMLGLPSGGIVAGEATMVGIMLVRGVDLTTPATFIYNLDDLGVHTIAYVTQEARMVMIEDAAAAAAAAAEEAAARALAEAAAAEEAAALEAALEAAAAEDASLDESGDMSYDGTDSAEATGDQADVGTSVAGASGPQAVFGGLDFAVTEDETLLARTLADTSWRRVITMLAVLSLATAAFFMKVTWLRWTSLAVTLVVLGFVDGGFLSVSHITSGIWAGPGIYLRDLPLLLIVSFTVITTLLWGRVFCGFMCPFGALQDIIDWVVPRRFQRPLPQQVHDRAVYVKYGVLALIVLPALLGSHVSLYEYFEPFGTVFFLSPSRLLWAIAGAFLLAAAVIPRFYCRYACPLGAALGVVSLISLNRIGRVEQCDHCKVCEQKCPTGAIRGSEVDFHECVRCNVCEVQLLEKNGACRHDMETISPRLVQLKTRATAGVSDA